MMMFTTPSPFIHSFIHPSLHSLERRPEPTVRGVIRKGPHRRRCRMDGAVS